MTPTTSVAELEHELLSPDFLRWLREVDDLGHDDCSICRPPVYYSGVVGRMHTKALDCPLCGLQIKRGAEVLVRIDYERHLWSGEHS